MNMMFWGVICYFIGLGMGYGLKSIQVFSARKVEELEMQKYSKNSVTQRNNNDITD